MFVYVFIASWFYYLTVLCFQCETVEQWDAVLCYALFFLKPAFTSLCGHMPTPAAWYTAHQLNAAACVGYK